MYANCIFCYTDLGRNETIEAFPIGTRIAFDPARGRLWAVCGTCGRWNLSPLEERWEAVEAAERSYRLSAVRAYTDNISVAKAADATELVRIGAAPRREIASWRYGDRFVQRWKRSMAWTAVGATGAAAFLFSGVYGAITAIPGGALLLHGTAWLDARRKQRRIIARLDRGDGSHAYVRRSHLGSIRLLVHDAESWVLEVEHDRGKDRLAAADALYVAGPVLAHLNRGGARRAVVDRALARVERMPGPDALFRDMARRNHRRPGDWAVPTLGESSRSDLLAMEMLSHDELERSALHGELYFLERAWREAEAIAAIADDLLLPPDISQRVRDAKGHPGSLRVQ